MISITVAYVSLLHLQISYYIMTKEIAFLRTTYSVWLG